MNGAYAFLDSLRKAGVGFIFGNVGTTEIPILDALVDCHDIQFVTVLHEAVAVGMAEGYSRVSKVPSVALVHTAAGTTNAVGALMNAAKEKAPILLVAGEKDSRLQGRGHFIEVPDLLGVARQFTKAAWKVTTREKIQETVFRAIRTCLTPPQGPVFLVLAGEALRATGEDLPPWNGPTPASRPVMANPADIEEAARLLLGAEAPLIVAGSELGRAGAVATLVEVAELLECGVIVEDDISLSCTAFPNTHRLYVGQMDPGNELPRPYRAFKSLLGAADVAFGAGCRMFMEFRYPKEPFIPLSAKLIHMHPDPLEPGRIYRADIGLVGDVALQLGQLRDALKAGLAAQSRPRRESYERLLTAAREEIVTWLDEKGREGNEASPIRLHQAMRVLSQVAPADALFVDESIRSGPFLMAFCAFTPERGYLGSGGGCLGWGLPAALGAKLASPERPVVAVIGNGSSLYTVQALWTAANQRIPVVVLIVNNEAYMAVRTSLRAYGGRAKCESRYIGCELGNPSIDFVSLSEGFGVPARRVCTPVELRQALEDSLRHGGPTLIEAVIDPSDYEYMGVVE